MCVFICTDIYELSSCLIIVRLFHTFYTQLQNTDLAQLQNTGLREINVADASLSSLQNASVVLG